MRFAIFGLTVSSSWGNGHATLWRGLIRALARQGHDVTFFERDVPYYAGARDLHALGDGAELVLYDDWASVLPRARRILGAADVGIVTSYCPDGPDASELVLEEGPGWRVFYDLDTPVTLARLSAGERPAYLPAFGLGDFDLVLSYTGGEALTRLKIELGARRVAPLYGHVDPAVHRPVTPVPTLSGNCSYLGTYAADRQATLDRLFLAPARRRPLRRFVLGGAGYPADFPWTPNLAFVRHVEPAQHPAFFCSSPLTLNVTRGDMAALGFCPSGRLFEAAACGVPVLSDRWAGLESFFEPGTEILLAEDTEAALAALERPPAELAAIGKAARERALAQHRSEDRARELISLIEGGESAVPAVDRPRQAHA